MARAIRRLQEGYVKGTSNPKVLSTIAMLSWMSHGRTSEEWNDLPIGDGEMLKLHTQFEREKLIYIIAQGVDMGVRMAFSKKRGE